MKEVFNKILLNAGFSTSLIKALEIVIEQESGWETKTEQAYTNTSNARLREVFPSFFKDKSDAFIEFTKEDPTTFFNYVYGSRFGNSPYEGFKYRGRGLNQLTFKSNYKKYGDLIGVNLVANPDLVNDETIAPKIAAEFFKEAFKNKAKKYSTALETATQAVKANAGFPSKISSFLQNRINEVVYQMGQSNGFNPIFFLIGFLLILLVFLNK